MEREAVYVRMCTEAGVRAYRELQKALEDPDSCEKASTDSVSSFFFKPILRV